MIPFLFLGCEPTFDNTIDVSQNNYQVVSIAGIKDTVDLKEPGDSILSVRVIFAQGSQFNSAYFDIYSSTNQKLNSSGIELVPISTNIYQNSFELEKEFPIGNYTVRIFVVGMDGNTNQVALNTFYFNNGQDNSAPVIQNTIVEPDTVVVTQPTVILTSVEAADSNGLSDISQAYFVVYRPDGTTSGNQFQLLDNGNPDNGDLIAGDGIFSLLIQVDETNDKGTYRFEFRARDRSGALSNIINHFVLIL
jgi:hypothetical protein